MKCEANNDTGRYQCLDRLLQWRPKLSHRYARFGDYRGVVAIGDLIFLEILQGIRNDRDYHKTKQSLLTLDQYEMFGKGMAIKCAENYRALRKKGITIRKTADVIIATFCIEQRIPLLYLDRDFIPFVDHLGLESAIPET